MTNIIDTTNTHALTMSSREIAELTGKRHDNVMRDTKKMLDELGEAALTFEGSYTGADGTQRPCYNLPKDLTLTLVAGYNVPLRKRIIDRWLELEAAAKAPAPVATVVHMDRAARETRLFMRQALQIASLAGLAGNQRLIAANRSTRSATGFDYLSEMGVKYLEAPQNAALLSVTDIGRQIGAISGMRVNHLLAEGGYQTGERDAKGRTYWVPTDKGVKAGGVMVDVERSNKSGQARQLRWASSIVEIVRDLIKSEGVA